jgi:hypothetical protein
VVVRGDIQSRAVNCKLINSRKKHRKSGRIQRARYPIYTKAKEGVRDARPETRTRWKQEITVTL